VTSTRKAARCSGGCSTNLEATRFDSQALTAERAKAMTAVEPEVDLQHRVPQNAAILQQTESS